MGSVIRRTQPVVRRNETGAILPLSSVKFCGPKRRMRRIHRDCLWRRTFLGGEVKKANTKSRKTTTAAKASHVIKRVNPAGLYEPLGYTHVVEATGARTVYVSGQVPTDPKGNVVGAGDFRAQATQVFENLKTALAAAGANFGDVVKTNYYVLDMSNIGVLREVRAKYLTAAPPASTLVQVGRLAKEEYLVEIEVVAVCAK